MTETSNILTKQYISLCNERALLSKECEDLPIGSIQQKKIGNGTYFYRQYREGKTVKTVFVAANQFAEVKGNIDRRKEIEKRLREINTEINQLIKALVNYLTKNENTKAYNSANIVLDPLTYQMYFTYGEKDILESRIEKAIPEFLMQGLLITDIQEAVGGSSS